MKKILVTGSAGFIGKNLLIALRRMSGLDIRTFDVDDDRESLKAHLREADVVYHLAGVNRPKREEEFFEGNSDLTRSIVNFLKTVGRRPLMVLTSSIQVERDNPYGKSKLKAEEAILDYHHQTGAKVYIYRLTNVFGKWSFPNYNTVVATFCHNIARGLDITISDPVKELELVYIDDLIKEFIGLLTANQEGTGPYRAVARTFRVTLGELAEKIRKIKEIRSNLLVPNLADDFMKCLHATYMSFLDKDDFAYPMEMKKDDRGMLFELIKSENFGQIFVSTTHPGVTRGNHFHDSKIEKFCVIKGKAAIRFRHILTNETVEYRVSDEMIKVVDIPPGYTHHIENLSTDEMIVLFWANSIFDPGNADTFSSEV